jgi:hypothetical protein
MPRVMRAFFDRIINLNEGQANLNVIFPKDQVHEKAVALRLPGLPCLMLGQFCQWNAVAHFRVEGSTLVSNVKAA